MIDKQKKSTVQLILEQWDAMSTYRTIKDIKEFLIFELPTYIPYGEIAVDTETTGLDLVSDRVLEYSFSFRPHEAFRVPIECDPGFKLLRALIENRTVIFYNAEFDTGMIENHTKKPIIKQCQDVATACFFNDISGYSLRSGLKAQAEHLLSLPTVELKDIIEDNTGKRPKKTDKIDYSSLSEWQKTIYGCQDADITLQLWQDERIQAAKHSMINIWDLEHALIRPTLEMMQNGLPLDVNACEIADKQLETACEDCKLQIQHIINRIPEEAGQKLIEVTRTKREKGKARVQACEKITVQVPVIEELQRLIGKKGFNPGSTKQKNLLLFTMLELPTTRKTKTGYSCDSEELENMDTDHPIIEYLLKHSHSKTRRSNYTTKLPGLVNPVTGCVHPSLWKNKKTGRYSCSDPNLQSVSRDQEKEAVVSIRSLFRAQKGELLTAADYSQIELRIAASFSQEPTWCDAYHGDLDVHAATAKMIKHILTGKPLASITITDKERQDAKTANFSILYGISPKVFARKNKMKLQDAEVLIQGWFDALTNVTKWIGAVHNTAAQQGFIKTFFGRLRPLPDINHPTEKRIQLKVQDFLERDWAANKDWHDLRQIAIRSIQGSCARKALSHRVQGTAADIMKISIVNVRNAIRKHRMHPLKMCLTVHDELVFRHPASMVDEVHPFLKETMEFPKVADGWVPLPVDVGSGENWSECK
jgi:DNA polymerase-1